MIRLRDLCFLCVFGNLQISVIDKSIRNNIALDCYCIGEQLFVPNMKWNIHLNLPSDHRCKNVQIIELEYFFFRAFPNTMQNYSYQYNTSISGTWNLAAFVIIKYFALRIKGAEKSKKIIKSIKWLNNTLNGLKWYLPYLDISVIVCSNDDIDDDDSSFFCLRKL